MILLKKTLILLLITNFLFLISISGCDNTAFNNKNIDINRIDREVDKITVNIVDFKQKEKELFYTLKLKNGSSHIIKQNVVYLSYPIIISPSNSMMNKCKVEGTGNKLDIKPNEEVMLHVIIPNEYFKNNPKIDSEHPSFEINGYFDEVTQSAHFMKSGTILTSSR